MTVLILLPGQSCCSAGNSSFLTIRNLLPARSTCNTGCLTTGPYVRQEEVDALNPDLFLDPNCYRNSNQSLVSSHLITDLASLTLTATAVPGGTGI